MSYLERQYSLLLSLDFPKAVYNHCAHFWTSKTPFNLLHCVFASAMPLEIIVADLINDIFIYNPNGSFSVLHHWTLENPLTKWISIIFLTVSPSLLFALGKDEWRGIKSLKTKAMYIKTPRQREVVQKFKGQPLWMDYLVWASIPEELERWVETRSWRPFLRLYILS